MSNEYKDWLRDNEEEKKIKEVSVSPNEVIVHTVDFDKFTVTECLDMHDKLQKEFPNIRVVTIPCSSSFKSFDKELLIEYLKETIKELENE